MLDAMPPLALTYDDVLLKPAASEVLPTDVSTRTVLARALTLNIPLISAAMDTVTEHPMAAAMAQAGGMGVIHRNLEPEEQARQVRMAKSSGSPFIVDPVTIAPDRPLGDAVRLMASRQLSGLPVVDGAGVLVGVITRRDLLYQRELDAAVHTRMTRKLVTGAPGIAADAARSRMVDARIERLPLVDAEGRFLGLTTLRDIAESAIKETAVLDGAGRLRVAAAIGAGAAHLERADLLIEAGCDAVFIDTAHGHSSKVLETVRLLRQKHPGITIVAGNVATAEATLALIGAGADAVKVGVGPGSICTTRVVAGVGVPQLSAVAECAAAAAAHGIPIIADGGIRASGDIVKAIAAGASTVMLGNVLAGTDEAPGETFVHAGRTWKVYRGMGSVGAMSQGSKDRYFQDRVATDKLVAEGVEGQIPSKGRIEDVLHQLVGGLRAGMGYTGAPDIGALQRDSRFVRISAAGLRESHVHDVVVDPNSQGRG